MATKLEGKPKEFLDQNPYVGVLRDDSGEELIRASAWRLRENPVDVPSELTGVGGPGRAGDTSSTLRPGFAPAAPEAAVERDFFDTGQVVGYHTAMEYRFLSGAFLEPGPATVWMRMRHPLVAGEEPSGLQRVMIIADSGNGISSVLPTSDDWFFINPELTVHLAAEPSGEWICLDAVTRVDPTGFGLATARLFDRDRLVGRGNQSLYIGPR